MMSKDKESRVCFFVVPDVLQAILENDNTQKAIECLAMIKKVSEMKLEDKNHPLMVTSLSCLLRAIYLANPTKFNLQNLQKIIGSVQVLPSFADFRNERAVIDEILLFSKAITGVKKHDN